MGIDVSARQRVRNRPCCWFVPAIRRCRPALFALQMAAWPGRLKEQYTVALPTLHPPPVLEKVTSMDVTFSFHYRGSSGDLPDVASRVAGGAVTSRSNA